MFLWFDRCAERGFWEQGALGQHSSSGGTRGGTRLRGVLRGESCHQVQKGTSSRRCPPPGSRSASARCSQSTTAHNDAEDALSQPSPPTSYRQDLLVAVTACIPLGWMLRLLPLKDSGTEEGPISRRCGKMIAVTMGMYWRISSGHHHWPVRRTRGTPSDTAWGGQVTVHSQIQMNACACEHCLQLLQQTYEIKQLV